MKKALALVAVVTSPLLLALATVAAPKVILILLGLGILGVIGLSTGLVGFLLIAAGLLRILDFDFSNLVIG
jgi:hypothetical protein